MLVLLMLSCILGHLRYITITRDVLKMETSIQIMSELLVSDLRDYKQKVNIYGKYYQKKSKTVEQKNPSLEILNDTLSPHIQ